MKEIKGKRGGDFTCFFVLGILTLNLIVYSRDIEHN